MYVNCTYNINCTCTWDVSKCIFSALCKYSWFQQTLMRKTIPSFSTCNSFLSCSPILNLKKFSSMRKYDWAMLSEHPGLEIILVPFLGVFDLIIRIWSIPKIEKKTDPDPRAFPFLKYFPDIVYFYSKLTRPQNTNPYLQLNIIQLNKSVIPWFL